MATTALDAHHSTLAHQTRRLEGVLVALHRHRAEQASGAPAPPALDCAIAEYSRELTRMRALLTSVRGTRS